MAGSTINPRGRYWTLAGYCIREKSNDTQDDTTVRPLVAGVRPIGCERQQSLLERAATAAKAMQSYTSNHHHHRRLPWCANSADNRLTTRPKRIFGYWCHNGRRPSTTNTTTTTTTAMDTEFLHGYDNGSGTGRVGSETGKSDQCVILQSPSKLVTAMATITEC